MATATMDMDDQILKYIDKCFEDAFKSENREFDMNAYNVKYIIVYDMLNKKHIFYPIIFWCKYDRVLRKVKYRMEKEDNYMVKNLHLYFGRTDEISIMDYKTPANATLDPNHYIAYVEVDSGKKKDPIKHYFISAVNQDYDEGVDYDKVIPAKKLYQLVMTYHGLTEEEIKRIHDTDPESEKLHLPNSVLESYWDFEKLHEKTFGYLPAKGFQILAGPGVKILSNQ